MFLHLARPNRAPTAGCVALDASVLRRLLARAGAAARGNPLRYYVAAFLLINGAFLTVFLGIPIFARPTLAAQAIWTPLILLGGMSAILAASAFGTMTSQGWARFVGLVVWLIAAVLTAGINFDIYWNASSILPQISSSSLTSRSRPL